MAQKTTFEQVREIVTEHLGLDDSQVLPESNLVNHLGADSLDLMEMLMQAEDEFDIEIEDKSAESCSTVQDVVDLIDRLVKAK